MKKIISICILLNLIFCIPARGDNDNTFGVNAPEVVSSDEIFRLVYVASGSGKVSDFSAPDFEGFDVLAGPISSSSTSIQIINGKRSTNREESFTYTLRPLSEGKFTIGSASVKIGSKRYESGSVNIEVVKAEERQDDDASGTGDNYGNRSSGTVSAGKDLMMKIDVSKRNVVKGEPIIATLKLYLQNSSLSGFEDVKFPTFNGFWSQEIETPQQIEFRRENLNGRVYNAALLRKYMLIPQQSGKIVIDPAEIVCLVQVQDNTPSRSIFDDFFGSFQTIRQRVVSDPVTINVSPLPSPAPASFKGGVGDFSMKVALSVDSIKAHEAASLKITVSGKGNINMIEAPSVTLPPDFEAYDVKKNDDISASAAGSSGSRVFEYPFIPRSPGEFVIPSIQFTYYDIRNGKYKTLASEELPIKVIPGENISAAVVAGSPGKQLVKTIGEDIRFISTSSSRTVKEKPFIVSSYVLYLLYAVIIVLFFVISYILKKNIVMKNDVAGTKNRKAKKVARNRLKLAETFLKQNLYSAFYEELHKAVDGYISDKLMLPPADMTREKISEELKARGKEECTEDLFALLDACEYARYAPSSGSEAMGNHYNSAVKIISEIES